MLSYLGRCPVSALLLLCQHGIQDRHHPVLKGTVIAVWDQHVAHPVEALCSQILASELEIACKGGCHALQPRLYLSCLLQLGIAVLPPATVVHERR